MPCTRSWNGNWFHHTGPAMRLPSRVLEQSKQGDPPKVLRRTQNDAMEPARPKNQMQQGGGARASEGASRS
eukprot:9723590-Alexandrium_andersonii.AAC.1